MTSKTERAVIVDDDVGKSLPSSSMIDKEEVVPPTTSSGLLSDVEKKKSAFSAENLSGYDDDDASTIAEAAAVAEGEQQQQQQHPQQQQPNTDNESPPPSSSTTTPPQPTLSPPPLSPPLSPSLSSPTTNKKSFTAPEPPRWRFVDKAKKTEGYSTTSAGRIVHGLSSAELVGSYKKLPKWKIWTEPISVEHHVRVRAREVDGKVGGDDGGVGRLKDVNDKVEVESDDGNKVGRLNGMESEEIVEETFEGTFGGFRKKSDENDEEDDAVVVEKNKDKVVVVENGDEIEKQQVVDNNTTTVEKEEEDTEKEEQQPIINDDELATLEGETLDDPSYAYADDVVAQVMHSMLLQVEQNGLVVASSEPVDEAHAVVTEEDDELDQLEKQPMEVDDDDDDALTEPSTPVSNPIPQEKSTPDDNDDGDDNADDKPPNKKRKWALLLCLLVLIAIIAATLGVLLGGGNDDKDENANKAIGTEDIISEAATPIPTYSPTILPTSSPTPICSTTNNTKLFSVSNDNSYVSNFLKWWDNKQNKKRGGDDNSTDDATNGATWVVRDVCSGDVVIKCLPCSSSSDDNNNGGEKNDDNSTIISTSSSTSNVTIADDVSGDDNENVRRQRLRRRELHDEDDGISECLPDDREYVFEVRETVDNETCCGFELGSFVVMYDDIVVSRGDWPQGKNEAEEDAEEGEAVIGSGDTTSNNTIGNGSIAETRTYFGGENADCPSSMPSITTHPSTMPSIHPTISGTYPPSPAPIPPIRDIALPQLGAGVPCREVIESELAGRVNGLKCEFCGFCEWKASGFNCYQRILFLANTYGTDQLEARQGLCERNQCTLPADGVIPEGVTAEVERYPRCENLPVIDENELGVVTATGANTLAPSGSPTTDSLLAPSGSPTTDSPTEPVTCDTDYEDFNLCIAIDMSGSVCNQGTGFQCTGCEPEIVCNDIDFDKGICCNNYVDVLQFTKLMVTTLTSSIPANQLYSVVGFADNAFRAVDMAPLEQTILALEDLTYTGGSTNHADAINACRTSLALAANTPEGDGRRKSLILLITDGDPSEPEGTPLWDAQVAATQAKSEGAFIIPLHISQSSSLVPETASYLQSISSDGLVFDVSEFTALGSLEDRLLAQILCQV